MKRNRFWAPCALLLLTLFSLTACDSGSDEKTPSEELNAMFADLQSALTLAFTASGKAAMPTVNCPQGGTLGVTSLGASGNAFNHDLAYNNCNGINGTMRMTGNSAFSGQDFTYNLTLNGNLEKQCDLSMSGFKETMKINLQNPQAYQVTLNGNMSAQCSSGTVTCTFNNVSLDAKSGQSTFSSVCK